MRGFGESLERVIEHEANQDSDGGFFARLYGKTMTAKILATLGALGIYRLPGDKPLIHNGKTYRK